MDNRRRPRPSAEHRPSWSEESSARGDDPRRQARRRSERDDLQGRERRKPRQGQGQPHTGRERELKRRERQTSQGSSPREAGGTSRGSPSRDVRETVFRVEGGEVRKDRPPRSAEETRWLQQRRRSAKRSQERERQARRGSRAPKVVYTQPRPFNGRRLLLQLGIVTAVVAAVMLGFSVFFKVEKVVVYGNKAYSAWTVQEASGIESGERLFGINNARASGKIKMALPYVNLVRIGINLPDTVNIYITEYDVVYAVQSQDESWWLVTSGGRVVEQTDGATAGSYTKVLGVVLDSPVPGEDAKAYEPLLADTDSTGATEDPLATQPSAVVTAASQLTTALSILDSLEVNDMVGTAASVDVTNINDIELWYGTRFKVRLGDVNKMDYKITCVKQSVAQLGEYETGILDVSFTTWTDGPFYTPFQ